MASFLDLAKHLEGSLYLDSRLHAESVYRGAPVPSWLAAPLETATQNAEGLTPVLVLNVKGRKVPDVLCIVRLSDLETLLGDR